MIKNIATYAQPGSILSDTMRLEDLIPCFAGHVKELAKANNSKSDLAEANRIIKATYCKGYYQRAEANYDLEWLYDTLNDYAPYNHYFGAHLGDGSDYGFWEDEDGQ